MKGGRLLGAIVLIALSAVFFPACKTCGADVAAHVSGPGTLRVGESAQLVVTKTYSNGSMNPDATPSFLTWSSSDPKIATVSPNDMVLRALAPGTVTITATPFVECFGDIARTAGTLTVSVTR
jgi:hypothetical protein